MRVRVLHAVVAVSAWLALPGPGRADDARADRARAWDALRSKLPEARYLRHSVAVEAIMREMATPRIDDADQWGLAGLLHDIDIGETASNLSRHGIVGAQILRDLGFNAAVIHAVNAHDDRAGVARTSRLDHAVYCADQVYWLVAAIGLSFPSDNLNAALPAAIWEKVQSVPKKRPVLGQVSRECAEIGLSMPQAVAAVQSASSKLSQTAAGK